MTDNIFNEFKKNKALNNTLETEGDIKEKVIDDNIETNEVVALEESENEESTNPFNILYSNPKFKEFEEEYTKIINLKNLRKNIKKIKK